MKRNIPLLLIFVVVFVDLLGFGIFIPILPAYTKVVLHAPESFVGIVIATYSFVQFIFNPIFGSLSDRYGRRHIILYTLSINAIGYLVFGYFAYSQSPYFLIASRVLAGIGGSSIGVAQAYIADVTTKEERSRGMGLIGVAFGLGFVFGPVIGGILSKFHNYSIIGYVSAGFSFIALLFSIFYLPESMTSVEQRAEKKPRAIGISNYKKVFAMPAVAIVISLFFVIIFSNANIYGTFALMGIEVYHFTDFQNGTVFAIVGIVSASVQGGIIRVLSKRLSDTKLIAIGTLYMAVGLGMLPFGGNFSGVAIITVIMGLGMGLLQPTFLGLVSKVAPDNEQGMVLGVNQSLSAFARMLGPLWGGFSYQYLGYRIPFLTGAFFIGLIFLFSIHSLNKYLPKKFE